MAEFNVTQGLDAIARHQNRPCGMMHYPLGLNPNQEQMVLMKEDNVESDFICVMWQNVSGLY